MTNTPHQKNMVYGNTLRRHKSLKILILSACETEDLARAFARFFETRHTRSLKVDIFRDLKTEKIRAVFHTDEVTSIPEFEALLQNAQKEMLEFMVLPPQHPSDLEQDHLLQMQHIWQRTAAAGALPLLAHFFENPDEEKMEEIRKLMNVSVNIYVKNSIIGSRIEAGYDVFIGDKL